MNVTKVTFIHSASAYGNGRCRCDRCREGFAALQADRIRRLREDPSLAEHGSASTYQNWGCRCAECTRANSAKTAAYRAGCAK